MGLTTMSEKELDRAIVLRNVLDGVLSKVKAALLLHISERQVRRLLFKLHTHGPNGLISTKRDKQSNSGTNDVSLTNSIATSFGPSTTTIGRNLTITSGGSVTQTGTITASAGTTTIGVTAANSDIILSQNNNLGTLPLVFAGTLTNIRDVNIKNINAAAAFPSFTGLTNLRNLTVAFTTRAIALPELSLTNGGALSITAGGAITQSGVLTVPGTSSFTAGAFPITLEQNNALTGAITLSNSGTNDVSLTNNIATSLSSSTLGGNLTVSSNGIITQSGTLSADGSISFDSDIYNITLANLISVGTTTLSANNANGAVTVGGLQLDTSFANLTGSVVGLTGAAAIPEIVNLNTITAGTHYFDGIDMAGSTPTPLSISEPLRIIIANNLNATNYLFNALDGYNIQNTFYDIVELEDLYKNKRKK